MFESLFELFGVFSGWEEVVFTVGGFAFAVNLLPTILDEDAAIPLSTSALTAFVLYLFTAAYLSLGMEVAVVSNTLTALAWTFIAVYRKV